MVDDEDEQREVSIDFDSNINIMSPMKSTLYPVVNGMYESTSLN